VDLVAAVVADEQPFEVVQPGEGAFNDPAHAAETGAVAAVAVGDLGLDAALLKLAAKRVGVVAAVGDDSVGAPPRSAGPAAHCRHSLHEWDQLGDVVAIAATDRPGQRQAGRVYEKVLLGTGSGSINRARARLGAPFFACT
jgi:hypothetical protein